MVRNCIQLFSLWAPFIMLPAHTSMASPTLSVKGYLGTRPPFSLSRRNKYAEPHLGLSGIKRVISLHIYLWWKSIFLQILLRKNGWTPSFTPPGCLNGMTTGGSPVNHRPRHQSPLQHSLKPIIRERRPIASLPSSAITTSILIIHFSADGVKKNKGPHLPPKQQCRVLFIWMSKLVGAVELLSIKPDVICYCETLI